MRLTKSDRDAFVRAVMADVPRGDYGEKARKLLEQAAYDDLPAQVKALVDAGMTGYLNRAYIGCQGSCALVLQADGWEPPRSVRDELQNLRVLSIEQQKKLRDLEDTLRAAINACTTLKQARDALPEFEKYLPADRTKTGVGNLPAATGLADKLRSAGWPKDAQEVKA